MSSAQQQHQHQHGLVVSRSEDGLAEAVVAPAGHGAAGTMNGALPPTPANAATLPTSVPATSAAAAPAAASGAPPPASPASSPHAPPSPRTSSSPGAGVPRPPPSDAEILRHFITNPAPPGRKVFCHVIRRRGTVSPFANYELYLEQPDQPPKFVMNARKAAASRTTLYRISLERNNYGNSAPLMGRVRANFLGTTFTVTDNGRNPFRTGLLAPEPDEAAGDAAGRPVRAEVACVTYEPNVMGFKGPRKITLALPPMTPEAKFRPHQPTREEDTLAVKMANTKEAAGLLMLHNKAPQWNEETQSFVLNFGGRVTLASVKNFQMVHADDQDYIVLQFGRVTEDKFTMDFQFPLTCLQAFGVALSSFDGKIACE